VSDALPIEAVTGVDGLIRQVEASLPPEKRSVGSFLALALITRDQLDEAVKKVFLQVQGDALSLYDLLTNSTLQQVADTLAFIEVGTEVQKAVLDAAKARQRLEETIETLTPLDPTAEPPLMVAELFYYVPDAGTPYVPLYTAPYRFMSQAQAAWSVYTGMKGTFAIYMITEIRDQAVSLAKQAADAAAKVLSPLTFPLLAIAAAFAGYLLLTRKK
jgi:hypothetical protein